MEYMHPQHKKHGNPPYHAGSDYPVWWETNDGRPAGNHRALILAIKPYNGRFTELFNFIFKLAAPNTRRGWLEMTVNVHAAVSTRDYNYEGSSKALNHN